MKESTAAWLEPMEKAADAAGIDTMPVLQQSMMPAREADLPRSWTQEIMQQHADESGGKVGLGAIDWISFGKRLLALLTERDPEVWAGYRAEPSAD
jgi:hypothetical protein